MKPFIIPYNKYSQGAKLLAHALSDLLGYKVFRGSTPKPNRVNIRWGMPESPATDKLSSLKLFKENNVPIPDFTTDPAVAKQWLVDGPIVARKLLRSSGGKGAVYLEKGSDLIPAPLYVKYIKKKKEFRVHVANGKVILVQEKRRRKGTNPDSKIRSHEHDWVFCTKDIVEPEGLKEIALAASTAIQLGGLPESIPTPESTSQSTGTPGAIDIIWNELTNRCYVLELNTAAGLAPSSASVYAKHFKEHYGLT